MSSSTTSYNYEGTAVAMNGRGLLVRQGFSDKRIIPISFDGQLRDFFDRVQTITGVNHGVGPPVDAWERFFELVMTAEHSGEVPFGAALFEAVRGLLEGYCQPEVKSSEILLKGSNIGFMSENNRKHSLGFGDRYGMATTSIADHTCGIFRLAESPQSCRDQQGQSTTQFSPTYNDATAVVELKHLFTGFAEYDGRHLELGKDHGPLVQALMYVFDVLNCLARRGYMVDSLPVVVLAGRVPKSESRGRPVKLCCVQATLRIPQSFGGRFTLQIDRCVPFGNKENLKMAIAIYLNTMVVGLDHAWEIQSLNRASTAPPGSLCCSGPMGDLRLIASPIPDAPRVENIKISQGEMYKFNPRSRATVSEWISDIRGARACLGLPDATMKDCLVKVSNKMVHGWLVPHGASVKAWGKIANCNAVQAVSDVFLAYVFHDSECVLFTVMKDLSFGDEKFKSLSRDAFANGLALWNAIRRLVETKLLVLATIDVVHFDIRCTPGKQGEVASHCMIHNVLGCASPDGTIELRLIDFESLALFDTVSPVDTRQDTAVSTGLFGEEARSAYHFLFWQILWMAHALYVTYYFRGNEYSMDGKAADVFQLELFAEQEDEHYKDFKDWISQPRRTELEAVWNRVNILGGETRQHGENMAALAVRIERVGREAIEETLTILATVFHRSSHPLG